MKILFFGTPYEPDLGPGASLFTILCKELVKRGHLVTVIAPVPHYPTGRVSPEYRGRWIWKSFESGVNVIRIGLPSVDRNRFAMRILQMLCYQLGTSYIGISQRYDVVFACNPSLDIVLPFILLVILRNKPAVYSVYDVYPDVGIKLGIFRNKLIIKTVATLERLCLSHSSVIQIISHSFKPGLNALGVPDIKMSLVNLCVDTDSIFPLPRETSFARDHELTGYFNIMYAGNIGLSQGLELILDVANKLLDQKDIRFIFIGDGSGKKALQAQAGEMHLCNVEFFPFQPREKLSEVLACSDLSLVILRKGIGSDSLPSKTFSIMASGRPVLISVDEESEVSKLIRRAEAGLWVPPQDPDQLVEAILALKKDIPRCERFGQNGRKWVEKFHSPGYAAMQVEKNLLAAITSHTQK